MIFLVVDAYILMKSDHLQFPNVLDYIQKVPVLKINGPSASFTLEVILVDSQYAKKPDLSYELQLKSYFNVFPGKLENCSDAVG